jgi:predicted dehydrogenase
VSKQPKPRLAIIGCGAVVERYHGPALKQIGWRPTLLVDPDINRARQLLRRFDAVTATANVDAHLDEIKAALVATPNTTHAAICLPLLQRGIHVLVEKPMTTSSEAAEAMIAAAASSRARFAVGLVRRFLDIADWTKALIEEGVLGTVQSFDFREGAVFDWPVTSPSFWRRDLAGGGVLMDIGPHVLDLVLWWLGDVDAVAYSDDAYGGLEADCLLELTMTSGAQGVVELSRTRHLRNTAIIRGSKGWVEVALSANTLVGGSENALAFAAGDLHPSRMPPRNVRALVVPELQDWLSAICDGRDPKVSGVEAARSVALIERCYRVRQLWQLPWVHAGGDKHQSAVRTA